MSIIYLIYVGFYKLSECFFMNIVVFSVLGFTVFWACLGSSVLKIRFRRMWNFEQFLESFFFFCGFYYRDCFWIMMLSSSLGGVGIVLVLEFWRLELNMGIVMLSRFFFFILEGRSWLRYRIKFSLIDGQLGVFFEGICFLGREIVREIVIQLIV